MVAAKRHNSKFNDRDKKQNHNGGKKNRANKQKFGNQKREKDRCYRCGGDHKAPECKIDRNKKCKYCGVKGHLDTVCFKNKNNRVSYICENSSERENNQYNMQLNVVDVLVIEHTNMREKITMDWNVNGVNITFDHDTGAAFSLMNIDDARQLFQTGTPIYVTNICARSFCNTPIEVKGFIIVNVLFQNKNFKLNLYLTTIKRPPLLGREWLRLMNVFPFDNKKAHHINIVENLNKEGEIKKLFDKFPNLLKDDMSPIRDFKACLTLKKGANPVFMKSRGVPFKLIPLVEKELDF